MGSCKACPANSHSAKGSTRIADCACVLGYYDELADSDDVSCILCPVGANCSNPGLTLDSLPLHKGYWRTGRTSAILSRCGDAASSDTACVGGSITAAASDLCKPWTTGPYCTLCNITDGSRYYDSGTSSCLECTGDAAATMVGLVLAVLAALLLPLALLAVLRKRFSKLLSRLINVYEGLSLRGKIKQLIALYQIGTQLENVFRVPMPSAVASLLDKLAVAFAGATSMPRARLAKVAQCSKAAGALEATCTCTCAFAFVQPHAMRFAGVLALNRLLRPANGLPRSRHL